MTVHTCGTRLALARNGDVTIAEEMPALERDMHLVNLS